MGLECRSLGLGMSLGVSGRVGRVLWGRGACAPSVGLEITWITGDVYRNVRLGKHRMALVNVWSVIAVVKSVWISPSKMMLLAAYRVPVDSGTFYPRTRTKARTAFMESVWFLVGMATSPLSTRKTHKCAKSVTPNAKHALLKLGIVHHVH